MCKRLIIFVTVFICIITSCKKDEDELPSVEINVQNLAGIYQISKISVKVGNAGEEDVTRFLLDSCERDDLLTLQANLTYSYVDAGRTCDSSINAQGKWSLSGKDTLVINDTIPYWIRRFDGTNLELNHTEVVNNVSANYTQYYIKQQ